MKLSNLIHEVWKDERTRELDVKLRKDEIKVIVKVTIDHMGKGLLEFGKLKLQGLFTLKIKEAKGRKIANPQTGEEMYIDDYKKINVEPSKKLKDGMKDLKIK